MDSRKWLEAAQAIDADIVRLEAASTQYKRNAAENLAFPYDGEEEIISSLACDESQQPQVSNALSHACTAT
jgi:hypothetical protein